MFCDVLALKSAPNSQNIGMNCLINYFFFHAKISSMKKSLITHPVLKINKDYPGAVLITKAHAIYFLYSQQQSQFL